jgi:hypothetical protein
MTGEAGEWWEDEYKNSLYPMLNCFCKSKNEKNKSVKGKIFNMRI